MQQIILTEPGSIESRDIPVPEPSEGEVVIKVNTALTCGTDLKAFMRGHKLISMPGPFGHEYSGEISGTGKGVENFREGDQVMGVHSAPCMECRYCKKELYNLCEVIMEKKALGAFSEYLLLPSNVVRHNLFHKPGNIGFAQAALLEPLSCVVHPYSNLNTSNIKSAFIAGAGPIGLMHLACLKREGITVIVSDISEERLAIAGKMGADFIFKDARPDSGITPAHIINNATDGMGVDLSVECTGLKSVWKTSATYVRRGGTVILFGGCPAGTRVSYDTHRLHYDELTIMGSFHYSPLDVRTAYRMLSEKEVDLSELISGEFAMKDIEKAFMLLKDGKGIKYALKP
ncbi:MAG: zinc-binding dehydrogenase [Nitrospirota bacterium]